MARSSGRSSAIEIIEKDYEMNEEIVKLTMNKEIVEMTMDEDMAMHDKIANIE